MQTPPRPPDTNQFAPGPGGPPQGQKYDSARQPEAGMPLFDEVPEAAQPDENLYQPVPGQEGRPPANRLLKAAAILMAAVAIILVLYFQVFAIRTIRISGLSNITQESALRLAGLNRHLFYFTVNDNDIRDAINANRYLVFEKMDKIFPSTLNITVTERRPFAFFTHLGVGYVLAQDGMVLEQTRELRDGQNLTLVNGLAVWGQQSPGSLPASTDPSQAEVLVNLFDELLQWGFDQQLTSIDLAQSLNIILQTRDGYTINLGAPEQLHAKVGTVASVVNELRRRQMAGGIIEATLPGEATYRAQQ